jgi:hypothetical protein
VEGEVKEKYRHMSIHFPITGMLEFFSIKWEKSKYY